MYKRILKNRHVIICAVLFLSASSLLAQEIERPSIWVKNSDKAALLKKIKDFPEVKAYYDGFKERVDLEIKIFQKDKDSYLSKLPLQWDKQQGDKIPPMETFTVFRGEPVKRIDLLRKYNQTGIDCGILYFLTGEKQYAEYASTILYAEIEALVQLTPNEELKNGGYMMPNDHLREAREIGAQVPILYDFVCTYLKENKLVYDFVQQKNVPFDFSHAQVVFKTYVRLALEHGIVDCNWPFLESLSLVGNILALDDAKEIERLLEFYLTKNTPHQDALLKAANHFLDYNGHWPESFNYSVHTAKNLTYLMTLLTKYNPELHLGEKYPHVVKELGVAYGYTYPNKHETVIFGDGHREYHPMYFGYELGYFLGELDAVEEVKSLLGPMIYSSQKAGDYKRFEMVDRDYPAAAYLDPLKLLWFVPELSKEIKEYPLPVTDELRYAGMLLQRNLSTTNKPEDGLMVVVLGGHHVHAHASGMNMELYGRGEVIGNNTGRSKYRTDIHENYYRLFASHNTVIVNGASEGKGDWANLGMNTVQKVALEPAVKAEPVSKDYSFTTSSFMDDKGELAEATQQRTVGIIRTSPTTGYYIDVFRSKSKLPNEFHDYIYHNIGEDVVLSDLDDKELELSKDPTRYKNSENKEWKRGKIYKSPGWHFFEKVETSGVYENPITALFTAKYLGEDGISMKVFTNKNEGREYTKVRSPRSTEGPDKYRKKLTPTLIIRQNGAAWEQPFAAIYEPYSGTKGTVVSVIELKNNELFKGFEIVSVVDGETIKQHIIVQENNMSEYKDKKYKVYFKGRYAVLTFTKKNKLKSAYIGEGLELKVGKLKVTATDGTSFGAYVDVANDFSSNATKEIVVKK